MSCQGVFFPSQPAPLSPSSICTTLHPHHHLTFRLGHESGRRALWAHTSPDRHHACYPRPTRVTNLRILSRVGTLLLLFSSLLAPPPRNVLPMVWGSRLYLERRSPRGLMALDTVPPPHVAIGPSALHHALLASRWDWPPQPMTGLGRGGQGCAHL